MEEDMLDVGSDFYWSPPPHLLLETDDLVVIADSMSYVPPSEAADSMSGLYPCREDSNSPDSCSAAVTSSPKPQVLQHPGGAGGRAVSKNMVTERDRRRRLNEKLYALRSVVPNITEMDKASIIRDAIAYIQRLQEEERRMLAEIAAIESSAAAAVAGQAVDDADSHTLRKRPRRAPDHESAPPVQILQVQVSDAGEEMALVSVRCIRAREAVAKVWRALEPLRLRVVTATVAAVGDTIVHTMFVQEAGEEGTVERGPGVPAGACTRRSASRASTPSRESGTTAASP